MQFDDFQFRPTHTFRLEGHPLDGRPAMQLSSYNTYASATRKSVVRRCMFEDRTVLESTSFVPLYDPINLLIDLREEVRDWQDALSGERDGLDELCARVDVFLESN